MIDIRHQYFYKLYSICLRCFKHKQGILVLTLISSILLVLLVKPIPQSLFTDPAWQLKALQQYLAGESPSLNYRVMPKDDDISGNVAEWIIWWPPGTQLLVYPFMAVGIAAGDALRIIAIASIIIGSLGWICWFSLFRLPTWVRVTFALALPWMRYPSNTLFLYSAEVFVYALTPWILLSVYKLSLLWSQQKHNFRIALLSLLLGFGMGFVYVLKYTAVFVSLGALLYLGLVIYQIFKNKLYIFSWRMVASFVLLIMFFLIPVLGLSLLNYKLGHNFNLLTQTYKINLGFKNLVYLMSLPVLALADAEAPWNYILFHPTHGIVTNRLWIGFVGLPGGLLLLWLIFRSRDFRGYKPALLAIAAFFINFLAMILILSVSTLPLYDARYFAPGSMAVLPFIIQSGIRIFGRSNKKIIRAALWFAYINYILIPLAYGYICVIAKVNRTPKNYALGPSHIYNPFLAKVNLKEALDSLKQDFEPATDIWYIPEPISSLDIPGRSIITHADFIDLASLQKQKYLSSFPYRVRVLTPYYFEENGKGQAIRASFVQAQGWSKKKIPASNYICWITTLRVKDLNLRVK